MAAGRATLANRVEPVGGLDYFPSAPWHGRAVVEVLQRLGLPLGETVHECAAGEGHLAHGLGDGWPRVVRSDIYPWCQRDGASLSVRDYLAQPDGPCPDWTVTNPPFGDKTGPFIRRAVDASRIGAVMFLQLRLLEGPGRHQLFRECGLYATAVVPRRGSGLRKGVWVPGHSTAAAYGLFVFIKPGVVPDWVGFRGEARQVWITPDACDRLSRPTDQIFAGLGGQA